MSSIRLFVLGALDRHGPMHGHQMRQIAEQERTELWTDFSVGSLYGALKRMATEGIVEVEAVERHGNLPPRTVYAITPKGREEMATYRAAVLRATRPQPDPVDLALQYSHDTPPGELRRVVEERREAIAHRLDSFRELAEHAAPHLVGLEPLIIRHTLLRLEAELRWHEELLDHLDQSVKE